MSEFSGRDATVTTVTTALSARPRGRHVACVDAPGTGGPAGDDLTLRFVHSTQQGFCAICGTVWPCSRARRHAASGHGTGTA